MQDTFRNLVREFFGGYIPGGGFITKREGDPAEVMKKVSQRSTQQEVTE